MQTRVALFVSLSVLGGAATLFSVTVLASRSWVAREQRTLLVNNALDHVALLETIADDPRIVDRALRRLGSDSVAAADIGGVWVGAERNRFPLGRDSDLAAAIEVSGVYYAANATSSRSLIVVPFTIGGTSGYLYELADHSSWDARRSRTRRIVLISAAILGFGAAIAGALAGRRLTKPLAAAAAAARQISSGGLTTRLPATDDPALSDLTATFNEMAETLESRLAADRRFNSDVSHELRSPLTTLVASLAVLQSRRHELSAANCTALDLLDADLQRFTRLVDDLLEMSRFDGGAATLVTTRVNVAEFVVAVAKTTGRDDLHVVMTPMVRVFEIELDKRRIARVISNLVDNAYAHGARPVWLTAIEFPLGDTSPSHVKITVEDRGPGVDLDRADELFERFNRGSRSGQSDGSGLGLALAREHVLLHGGTISFEARPRGINGTCVAVTLPLRTTATATGQRTSLT